MQNSALQKIWWPVAFLGVMTLFFAVRHGLITAETIRAIQTNSDISTAFWARVLLSTAFTISWCAMLWIVVLPGYTIDFSDQGLTKMYQSQRRIYPWCEITKVTVRSDSQIFLEAPHWKVTINPRLFSSPRELIREVEKHVPPQAIKQSFADRWGDLVNTLSGLLVLLLILLIPHLFPQSRPFMRELMYGNPPASKSR